MACKLSDTNPLATDLFASKIKHEVEEDSQDLKRNLFDGCGKNETDAQNKAVANDIKTEIKEECSSDVEIHEKEFPLLEETLSKCIF